MIQILRFRSFRNSFLEIIITTKKRKRVEYYNIITSKNAFDNFSITTNLKNLSINDVSIDNQKTPIYKLSVNKPGRYKAR